MARNGRHKTDNQSKRRDGSYVLPSLIISSLFLPGLLHRHFVFVVEDSIQYACKFFPALIKGVGGCISEGFK
jgi:hypothetical protein